jgi:DNA polymerase-3 subunit alpha
VNESTVQADKINALKALLSVYSAEVGLPVVIDYTNQVANVQMKSHDGVLYLPEDDLLEALIAQGWQPEVVL